MKRVGIAFCNTFGNLIFLSAAVKILRKWGYEVDLLTDLNSPNKFRDKILKEYGSLIFNDVKSEFDERDYEKIYHCGWSIPSFLHEHKPVIDWNKAGIHEVQLYLSMIGASWNDFDGYIFPVSQLPNLPKRNGKLRIALGNAYGTEQAEKKKWNKFSELSKVLREFDFEVVLLGLDGELEGCEYDFDFRGKTTIHESARVLQQCDALIASSTALTLVADTVSTPVLLLEGPMITARAHPLQSKFEIVRKYISCAPCFQTPFWALCKKAHCMDMIEVQDVVKKLFKLLNKSERKIEINYSRNYQIVDTVEDEVINLSRKIVYATSISNRYSTTVRFFESLKESKLLPGMLYIINDRSTDPRVESFIKSLKIPGLVIKNFKYDLSYKESDCIASTRTSNFLLNEIRSHSYKFDYFTYFDSDLIFKPYWLQRSILTYEEAKQKHKIWGITPLNNQIDKFNQNFNDSNLYEAKFSKYRLRGGMSIAFVIEKNIFDNVYGWYKSDVDSSDLSKSKEMMDLGYYGATTVPSLVQHIGCFESNFRNKIGVYAEDF